MRFTNLLADPKRLKWFTTGLVVLYCLYIVVFSLGTSNLFRDNSHSSIAWYLRGNEEKPFVFRALVVQTARLITFLTPTDIQQFLCEQFQSLAQTDYFDYLLQTTGWNNFSTSLAMPEYLYPMLVIALLIYSSLVVYGLTLYQLAASLFPRYKLLPACSALFGLTLLLPFVQWRFQLYDASQLALTALCLLLMHRQHWRAYLTCFSIACLNKETTILQTLVFFTTYVHAMERRRFKRLLAWQCVIYIALITMLHIIFADHPGESFYKHYFMVLLTGMKAFDKSDMMVLVMSCWLILANWRELPLLLRNTVWVGVSCAGIYYLFGQPREYRVLFDAFPGLTLIAAHSLFKHIEPQPV